MSRPAALWMTATSVGGSVRRQRSSGSCEMPCGGPMPLPVGAVDDGDLDHRALVFEPEPLAQLAQCRLRGDQQALVRLNVHAVRAETLLGAVCARTVLRQSSDITSGSYDRRARSRSESSASLSSASLSLPRSCECQSRYEAATARGSRTRQMTLPLGNAVRRSSSR